MIWYILIFVIFHLICGVLSYGLTFGYFQKAFPSLAERDYREDKNRAIISAFLGIAGLLAILIASCTDWQGFKWK